MHGGGQLRAGTASVTDSFPHQLLLRLTAIVRGLARTADIDEVVQSS
jgi:hypothetical protein